MAKTSNPSELSDADLVDAYVESVQTFHAIEHVGAKNRYVEHCDRIFRELRDRDPALGLLRPLLDHADPVVAHSTAIRFRTIDHAAFERVVKALAQRPDEIGREAQSTLRFDEHFQEFGYPELQKEQPTPRKIRDEYRWQIDNVPSAAMSQADIVKHLRDILPAQADPLAALARPAIGLWPRITRATIPIGASRWGGIPDASPGWSWPMLNAEPLLFVGQIDCAALVGLPCADRLPSSGLLSFFGDHDTVMACGFGADDIAVYHWPDIRRLRPAEPPIDLTIVFPTCEFTFRPLLDLPDPSSRTIEDLLQNPEQVSRYRKIYEAVHYHGIPQDVRFYCSFSKLFGWPRLVQHELDHFHHGGGKKLSLLLQVDDYSNGEEAHGWGPGGSLYFLMSDPDLRARRFDRCQFEMQFT